MGYLLDTHALLWWLAGDERLSPAARQVIGDGGNKVLVSAASGWEIATKVRIGKLSLSGFILEQLPAILKAQQIDELPVTMHHALHAGVLAGSHRDPFDRMLMAQARDDGLVLISNEELFDSYGVQRLW